MWSLPNLPMAGGAAVVRQSRKLVAAVNGSNLALEHYRDIRSLAAGSQIVRPCFQQPPEPSQAVSSVGRHRARR